jgi:multidrug efflux pump subunit AcrA (membrane-fusion protein)
MKKIIWLIIVILIVGFFSYRFFHKKEKVSEVVKEKGLPVEVVSAFRGEIIETIPASGTIKSENEIRVFPKAMGRIEKIYVKEGDFVKKGDVIAQIERDVLIKQIQALKTALAAAEVGYKTTQSPLRKQELENLDSGIEVAKIGLDLAEKNYKRHKNLYESGSISKAMFEQAEFQYNQAKSAYENLLRQREMLVKEGARDVDKESAKAQIENLKAQLKQAEDALKETTVTSPITGWVSSKFFNEGEVFSASIGMPLFIIVDNKNIYLEVNLSEKEITKVRKGQKVNITIDAIPEKKFSGLIREINPQVTSYSRATQLKIDILNKTPEIKSGMFARCEIETSKRTNSILIPKDCPKKKGEKNIVFVVKNNVAEEREIKIGLSNTENIEVLEGIEEGEKVVISGQEILKNKDRVKIIK